MKTEYALKSNEVVNIIPIGDLHLGSAQCNIEFFEHWQNTLKKIKKNRRIYLMGDLLESASKNVANSSYNTTMSLDDQKAQMIEIFEPLADDIICYCIGNHEARLIKDYDFNIVKDICRELNIQSTNQLIDSFKINDFEFDIMVRHGKGSNRKRHLAMGKLEDKTEDIEADLYLEGHNHRCMNWDKIVRNKNGIKRKYYGYTGAFLNYDGYPDSSYLPVEPPSYQNITINQNRIVKFNRYSADGCNIKFM